jgi:hypothetical protein
MTRPFLKALCEAVLDPRLFVVSGSFQYGEVLSTLHVGDLADSFFSSSAVVGRLKVKLVENEVTGVSIL